MPTTAATSRGLPSLPIGCSAATASRISGRVAVIGLSITPGPTALILSPCDEYSSAALRVNPTTACLAACAPPASDNPEHRRNVDYDPSG